MPGNRRRAAGSASTPKTRQSVKSDGTLGGFDLPEGVLGPDETWHPMTVRWWEAWRRSPQAVSMMTDPDWYFLLDTALVHHNMWSNQRWEFANEVRMRVGQFGATPAARKALQLEIEVPEQYPVGKTAKPENVSDLDERRKRILGA